MSSRSEARQHVRCTHTCANASNSPVEPMGNCPDGRGLLDRFKNRLATAIWRNRFLLGLASLVWLLWRSGPQPQRLAYPCQQMAASNAGILAVLFVPSFLRWRKARGHFRGNALVTIVGVACLAFVLFLAGKAVYSNYDDVYTPGNPAAIAWTPADVSAPAMMKPRILTPTNNEAVVALNRDPSVVYGSEPYGPGAGFDPLNPSTATAYGLIWKTVSDLHLGPADNPLANLIQDVDGDGTIEVLIKPNHVEYFNDVNGQRSPCYSHPATIRPLVDMAAKAGAQQIRVGDGSDGTGAYFTSKMDRMGFTAGYFTQLKTLWPGRTIERVDFQKLNYWSWVNLGAHAGEAGVSSYVGSGYSEDQLIKAHQSASYFNTADPHGRPGPGQDRCMGWLALSDYVLDADVVIDLAKLKVHYLGVSTAILKNWVGITMFSTFDMSQQHWSRVCHTVDAPSSYEQGFGNDFLWREMVDAHRAVLYWRNDTFHQMPQRRYLCVLDAINCAERYHVGGGGDPVPYWLHTTLASVDPVAIDAVGARLQRYDLRWIPIINNAHATSVSSAYPVGTSDPGKVRVVGGTAVNNTFDHVFAYERAHDPGLTWPDWGQMTINDTTPPSINTLRTDDVGDGQWQITANITGAHTAFYCYGDDGHGAPLAVRLGRNGDEFGAIVTGAAANGYLIAQDEHYNTVRADVLTMPAIWLSTHQLSRSITWGDNPSADSFGIRNSGIGTLNYAIEVDDAGLGWLSVDPIDGSATSEEDTITVNYACTTLPAGTYAGTITVSDPNSANLSDTIAVTVTVQPVKPDFGADGDVDQADFGHLQRCISGTQTQTSPACLDADLDGNLFVDGADIRILLSCMSGSGTLPDPQCDK